MTYLLGRRFGGPVAGLIAAGVIAFYPALLEYQGLLLTEPLAATLLVAGLVAVLHGRRAVTRNSGARRAAWARGSGTGRRPRPAGPGPPRVPAARPRACPWSGWRGRRCGRRVRRSGVAAGRRLAARDGPRPRPVDDPQRGRARSLRADLDRRRQGALHRHQPRGRRRRGRAARRAARRTAGAARQARSRRPASTIPTAWSSSACSSGSRRRATRTWKPTPRSAGWAGATSKTA